MDLDIERGSSHRVRSFDRATLEAPRKPYFYDPSNVDSDSWKKAKTAYRDGQSRSRSIPSPRPPRHVVLPAPETPKPCRSSKSLASASPISISSSSDDGEEDEGKEHAVHSASENSASSASSSSSSSSSSSTTSTDGSSTSVSETSTSTDSSSDSDDTSSDSTSTVSSPASSEVSHKRAHAQKTSNRAVARVPLASGGDRWRPSYNEESIAAAAAAAAILEKERVLKQMELELIKEKRDFAKEVKRRAAAPTVFDREEDALAQMQRLVQLEGGDVSVDAYLAATERTATFLDDSARRFREPMAQITNTAEDGRTTSEELVRGSGLNRVSAYQALQRLMGVAQRVGARTTSDTDESDGCEVNSADDVGGLNDSRTIGPLPLNATGSVKEPRRGEEKAAAGSEVGNALSNADAPLAEPDFAASNGAKVGKPTPSPPSGSPRSMPIRVTVQQGGLATPDRVGPASPAQSVKRTHSASRQAREAEQASVPTSTAASLTASMKVESTSRGLTVKLPVASPLDEPLSASAAGSGVASPMHSGTPAVVSVQSDRHRSDTSASPVDLQRTPEPCKPTTNMHGDSAATASTSQESLMPTTANCASASSMCPGRAKKKVRVRVRRRSRSVRRSKASVSDAAIETATEEVPPPPAKQSKQFLSPTPANDPVGLTSVHETEASQRRSGWLMPPPAEHPNRRSSAFCEEEYALPASSGPQYVQAALPAMPGESHRTSQPQPSWAAAPADWPMSAPPQISASAAAAQTSTAAVSLRYLTANGPLTDRQFKRLLCSEYVPAGADTSGSNGRRQSHEPFGNDDRRPTLASTPGHVQGMGNPNNRVNEDDSFVVDSPPSSIIDDKEEAAAAAHRRRPSFNSAAVLFPTTNAPQGSGDLPRTNIPSGTAPPVRTAEGMATTGVATSPGSGATAEVPTTRPGQPIARPDNQSPAFAHKPVPEEAIDSDGSVLEFPPPPPTRAPDLPGMDGRPAGGAAGTNGKTAGASGCCGGCGCCRPGSYFGDLGHWFASFFRCICCCCCDRRQRRLARAAQTPASVAPPAHNALGAGAVAPVMMPQRAPAEEPNTEALMR